MKTLVAWWCPTCGASITLNVKIATPPTHSCRRRSGRVYPLVPREAGK